MIKRLSVQWGWWNYSKVKGYSTLSGVTWCKSRICPDTADSFSCCAFDHGEFLRPFLSLCRLRLYSLLGRPWLSSEFCDISVTTLENLSQIRSKKLLKFGDLHQPKNGRLLDAAAETACIGKASYSTVFRFFYLETMVPSCSACRSNNYNGDEYNGDK